MPVTITQTVTRDVFEDAPYLNQLKTNFGQQVGLSLNLPIYNNHRNLINTERAKVNILNAKLQSDLTKQQLKTDVQNALASARAAYRSLAAANKTVEAAEAAFEMQKNNTNSVPSTPSNIPLPATASTGRRLMPPLPNTIICSA